MYVVWKETFHFYSSKIQKISRSVLWSFPEKLILEFSHYLLAVINYFRFRYNFFLLFYKTPIFFEDKNLTLGNGPNWTPANFQYHFFSLKREKCKKNVITKFSFFLPFKSTKNYIDEWWLKDNNRRQADAIKFFPCASWLGTGAGRQPSSRLKFTAHCRTKKIPNTRFRSFIDL